MRCNFNLLSLSVYKNLLYVITAVKFCDLCLVLFMLHNHVLPDMHQQHSLKTDQQHLILMQTLNGSHWVLCQQLRKRKIFPYAHAHRKNPCPLHGSCRLHADMQCQTTLVRSESSAKQLARIEERLWSTSCRLLTTWREEIGTENGLLFKGHCLIVPGKLWVRALQTIHKGHFSIEKMNLRAREALF